MQRNSGAARAVVAQLDAETLSDRGVIMGSNPESCINAIRMYEDIGVDRVTMSKADRDHP